MAACVHCGKDPYHLFDEDAEMFLVFWYVTFGRNCTEIARSAGKKATRVRKVYLKSLKIRQP